MKLSAEGTDDLHVGPVSRKATRWLVNLELGGMMGVLASIAGKDPPDLRYWIAAAPLPPAFVKFEGPFYLNGPIWRIELSGPRWSEGSSASDTSRDAQMDGGTCRNRNGVSTSVRWCTKRS